jgi:hypothetical protein
MMPRLALVALLLACQPLHAQPSNDLCADAAPLRPGRTPFSNQGAGTDGPAACALIGADVWYQFEAAQDQLVSIALCGSDYDTAVAVYLGCGCAPVPAELIACNDDACGTRSEVFLLAAAGQCYLVQVGGFAASTGSGVLEVAALGPPCSLACDADPEAEPCGSSANGGCNSAPPTFGTIACGDAVCGTTWAQGGMRDTDWYLLEVNDAAVQLSLHAESPTAAFLLDTGGTACFGAVLLGAVAWSAGCAEATSEFVVPAGTYSVLIAAAGPDGTGIFDGFPCGSGTGYRLAVECGPPTPAACVDAPGDCFAPHATPGCDDEDCCTAICAADPFCCAVAWDGGCSDQAARECANPCLGDVVRSGVVDVADLIAVLLNWACTAPPPCLGDADGDGAVGVDDLILVIMAWGDCA